MKINKKYIFFIFLTLAFTYNEGLPHLDYNFKKKTMKRNFLGFKKIYYIDYFKNDVQIGYDSNVLKISTSEDINQPSSAFISIKPALYSSFKIFKKSTKLSLSTKINYYLDVENKSNFGYAFTISQRLSNNQRMKFQFSYVDNIYLRKYFDLDNLVSWNEISYGYDCYFDLTKHKISYESPYFFQKEKFEISIYNETQFYNPEFTEFDLNITGIDIKIFSKSKSKPFSFTYGFAKADSLFSHNHVELAEDLDGNSLRLADRSYKEYLMKLAYSFPLEKDMIDFMIISKNRKYLSNHDLSIDDYNTSIIVDELHKNRKHRDLSIQLSYRYKNKNKIQLTYRKRTTRSPYKWVENLKSFNKVNLQYTIYFNKIKLGL